MPIVGLASEPALVQIVPTVEDIAHFDTALPEEECTRFMFATKTGGRFDADSHDASLRNDSAGRGAPLAPCSAPAPKAGRSDSLIKHDSRIAARLSVSNERCASMRAKNAKPHPARPVASCGYRRLRWLCGTYPTPVASVLLVSRLSSGTAVAGSPARSLEQAPNQAGSGKLTVGLDDRALSCALRTVANSLTACYECYCASANR